MKMKCERNCGNLRTADVFPVVASLAPKNKFGGKEATTGNTPAVRSLKLWGTVRNIFWDQGDIEHNFWEHGNSVKVNFGEYLNLFLRNKGTTVNF